MPLPIFLFVEDLYKLFQGKRSKDWCYLRYREIKDAYGLNKRQYVSIDHFCDYEGVTPERVYKTLGYSQEDIKKYS